MLKITLKVWPVSVNMLYRNCNGGVIMSKRGRVFMKEGLQHLALTMNDKVWSICPIKARLHVIVTLNPPDKRIRDLDNHAKGVLDLMTKAGIWKDDSQIDHLELIRGSIVPKGKFTIEIYDKAKIQSQA